MAQGIFARQTNDNLPASSSINICCKRQYLKSRAEKRIVEMWKIKEKPDRLANQIKSNQFYRQMRPAADCHNYFRIQRQLPIPHSDSMKHLRYWEGGKGNESCGNGNI